MCADWTARIIGKQQSVSTIDPYNLKLTYHFIRFPTGGASATASSGKLSILNKTFVNRVTNQDTK